MAEEEWKRRTSSGFVCALSTKINDVSAHLDAAAVFVHVAAALRLASTSSARSFTSAFCVRRRICSITLPHRSCWSLAFPSPDGPAPQGKGESGLRAMVHDAHAYRQGRGGAERVEPTFAPRDPKTRKRREVHPTGCHSSFSPSARLCSFVALS
jgi:hypothetical protein